MKILVTGASGFIGSHVVEEALRRDMEVWAAVRPTSSKAYLQDERIHFIELDLFSEEQLTLVLASHTFDYIVYAAGVTKCLHESEFYRVNVDGLKLFVEVMLKLNMPIKRFIYLSTLGVFGPIKDTMPHLDIHESDFPRPNTVYGKSKLQAEQFLDSIGNDFPYIVLRPTGVYGPRDKDYFLAIKSIDNHFNFSVGFRSQHITFVYVDDVIQAIFLALNHGMSGRKYFLSDGQVYQASAFGQLVRKMLGNTWCISLTFPIFFAKLITVIGELLGRMTGKPTTLNRDKFNILKQRNWRCDIEPTMDELGYHPKVNLEEGLAKTIKWYQDHHWLPKE